MALDNAYNQSAVAYENGPKEVNTEAGMPGGSDQFGKGNKMPQDMKAKKYIKHKMHKIHGRHSEHR